MLEALLQEANNPRVKHGVSEHDLHLMLKETIIVSAPTTSQHPRSQETTQLLDLCRLCQLMKMTTHLLSEKMRMHGNLTLVALSH